MLDIYEMQIFLAAAETGSFSEAGRRLQLSQPAVSMQIRALEKRLGVDLFHRAGRHIRLTEAGQVLIPLARDLVNRSIHIKEVMASLQGDVIGMLRLACSTTCGKYVLPRLIARFMEHHPDVRVTIDVVSRESALNLLLDGHSHLAITSLRELSREVEYRPFIIDKVVLIVSPDHPWAMREWISVDELPQGRFILREFGSGTQQAVSHALAEHDLSLNALNTVMVLGNSEAILVAVTERIGAAFISRRVAAEAIACGKVVEVPIAGIDMMQQLYLVRHAGRAPSSAQAAFWEYVYLPENRALLTQPAMLPVR